jgi:hypothetical protein
MDKQGHIEPVKGDGWSGNVRYHDVHYECIPLTKHLDKGKFSLMLD